MKQIRIISPVEGQTILGDKITVSFIAGDFTVGQDGYIRLWMDNPIMEASTAAKISANFDYTLSGVPAGSHKLTLEAVNLNNTPFNPPVKQTVAFTTTLPRFSTVTPTPVFHGIASFSRLITVQNIAIVIALAVVTIGLTVKIKWGKPKNWE